jgi:hypothetical protein
MEITLLLMIMVQKTFILEKGFITLAEWRDRQIDKILNDD